jgi:hypothetical protein
MSDGYDFDSEADEGIFDDPERRAAGDKDALADMQEEGAVLPVTFKPGEDGIPVPDFEDLDLEGEPISVTWRELLCLADCRWYTQVVQSAGTDAEGGELIEVHRWCGRLRTWAEQTSLDDARVYGCTSFEPDPAGQDPAELAEAIGKNAEELANIRREARQQNVNLGVCAVGPCHDFVEVVRHPVVKSTENIDRESLRYCVRLSGLGRLYDLRKNPVFACNAYRPRGSGPQVAKATVQNAQALEKIRQKMAGKAAEEEPGDDDRQPE